MPYIIKELPEDFVVEEIPIEFAGTTAQNGVYTILRVTKRELNTEEAAVLLARALRVPRKAIGYAGSKDRHAITTQYFSVKGQVRADEVKNDGVVAGDRIQVVAVVGQHTIPLSLGDLNGNRFTIVIRNLEEDEVLERDKRDGNEFSLLNFFGAQRFGRDGTNARIGKALVKKEFKKACELLNIISRAKGNDFVGALRTLPKHTLMLYLHAYQSALWNKALERFNRERERPRPGGLCATDQMQSNQMQSNQMPRTAAQVARPPRGGADSYEAIPDSLPLIGFGTELDELSAPVKKVYEEILAREEISPRDFIVRQLQGLSPEGDERASFMTVSEFSVSPPTDDDLHPGKKKQRLKFCLPKGSYATVLINQLFKSESRE